MLFRATVDSPHDIRLIYFLYLSFFFLFRTLLIVCRNIKCDACVAGEGEKGRLIRPNDLISSIGIDEYSRIFSVVSFRMGLGDGI